MRKNFRSKTIMIKISSIAYLSIFIISTIAMFFLFNNNLYHSPINIFLLKSVFFSSAHIIFGEPSILLILYMLFSLIALIISGILMIFTRWAVLIPITILSIDVIYQLYLTINTCDYMLILGIIAEIVGIALMTVYFLKFKGNKTKYNSVPETKLRGNAL